MGKDRQKKVEDFSGVGGLYRAKSRREAAYLDV